MVTPPDYNKEDYSVLEPSIDLSSCDRELVQFSQAIQPFGMLLAVDENSSRITEASANVTELTSVPVSQALKSSLDAVLSAAQAAWVMRRCDELKVDTLPVYLGVTALANSHYEVFANRIGGKLILEFEGKPEETERSASLYGEVRSCMAKLQLEQGLEGFLEIATQSIRKLTGFDRVLAYKFLGDGSGHIQAEARRDDLNSFVGLHFPPGDVPAPARRVLSLMWVRHQPDIGYIPVPVLSSEPDAAPLDLSYSSLRSTSSMCNRYYLNLGVRAKMVVALLHHGEMWGAIICQHETKKSVSYETRMACETIAHTVSMLLHSKESALQAHLAVEVHQNIDALIERVSEEPSWAAALTTGLLNCLPVGGSALLVEGGLLCCGITPSESEVLQLVEWLKGREQISVFSTYSLSSVYPAAEAYREAASGLLAIRLEEDEYLLWFRPEMAYEVSWAGDPQKPVEVDERDGRLKLAPRTSFEMKRGMLRGLAEPWEQYELEAAGLLKRAIATIRQTDELNRSVGNLTAVNTELESFAYIASHDLREPLRGIRIYSAMLTRKASGGLAEADLGRLETIERLAGRMDELLESLLQCSRLGRAELKREMIDLNLLLNQAIETIEHQLESPNITVRAVSALPTTVCDASQIQQVFVNLIVNGLKYNSSPEKVIEVGYQKEPEEAIFVRDNGIGIAEGNHQEVFKIFRRLHGKNEFGGGSGAGLTIVQKIVQQHGGRIWLESAPTKGTTFFFTLPGEQMVIGESSRATAI